MTVPLISQVHSPVEIHEERADSLYLPHNRTVIGKDHLWYVESPWGKRLSRGFKRQCDADRLRIACSPYCG